MTTSSSQTMSVATALEPPSRLQTSVVQGSCEDYEQEHVHSVYEQIASHFSSTRYKPWPIIERFLLEQTTGSIGVDVGCGNGKYLAVNPNVFLIGSDRSQNLVRFGRRYETHDVLVADALAVPHPGGQFDFALSIAVIHHLSTPERRTAAIGSLLDTLRPGGRGLVYVWALEQKTSRRGWDDGDDQDVMVPWVIKGKKVEGQDPASGDQTFNRYYHLYRKGELEESIDAAGGRILEAGYEKDNWWAIATPRSSDR